MPVFFSLSQRVLFVHVPKTGGTTMERMLTTPELTMRFRETRKTAPDLMSVRRCSPQHYHGELLREVFDLSRFSYSFLIVRDPVARFRSEYLMRTRKDLRLDAGSVEAWADHVLERYAADPYVLDNHLRPQSDFVVPGAEVFHLEDGLESIADRVEKRIGHRLTRDVARGQDSVARAGVPSSAVTVSPRLEERLRSFYAADYAAFGY